jgi:acetyl-CoA synthetase
MAMTSDAARQLVLQFAPTPADAQQRLREILSDRVHISNPFDFHTHIWFDRAAQRAMFEVVQHAGYDAVGFMLDCPPEDAADDRAYVNVVEEFAAALSGSASRGRGHLLAARVASPATRGCASPRASYPAGAAGSRH